jgi:hypothetical protein
LVVCQGETPRPESPGSRAGVSALEVAAAIFRGDPLHHFHLREAPYKTTEPYTHYWTTGSDLFFLFGVHIREILNQPRKSANL